MEIEVGERVSVTTPRRWIDGRVTRVDETMVAVILDGQQFETELFMEEINVRLVRSS